jgi:hypothetical protein
MVDRRGSNIAAVMMIAQKYRPSVAGDFRSMYPSLAELVIRPDETIDRILLPVGWRRRAAALKPRYDRALRGRANCSRNTNRSF